MTDSEQAIRQYLDKPRPVVMPCGCMGPQDDEPVCPCKMQWVEKVNGNYYQIDEKRYPDGIQLLAVKIE